MMRFHLNNTGRIALIVIITLAVVLLIVTRLPDSGTRTDEEAIPDTNIKTGSKPKVEVGLAELPAEANFTSVAENGILNLKLDATTGHFKVTDQRNGSIWYSYPNPSQWLNERQEGVWRSHLRSPIMFQYIDLSNNKSQPKESNLLDENGTISDVATVPDGFRLTFHMPSKGITVSIEVTIDEDSVVTRIIDSSVKEGSLNLVWMRLYPFFGAGHSEGQDGYLFIPDGSGALIRYQENKMNTNRLYNEKVYGPDQSFQVEDYSFSSAKRQISLPVFGLKSGDQGFIAVLEGGAESASILASPSGVFSGYNWVTAQQNYRASYRQVTNAKKETSFLTYSKTNRFGDDRVVRYMLLPTSNPNYTDMAQRYRLYLMDTYDLKSRQVDKDDESNTNKVPLTVTIVGAELEKGMLTDNYLKQTTFSEAEEMVQRLANLGIDNMIVNYLGWQDDGYSAYGGLFPVDKRLGGNEGMKRFVTFAHTLHIPVYLQADYSKNTTGNDGFSKKQHGLRDLGGSIMDPYVSLKWLKDKTIDRDIIAYKELGIDGLTLSGIGKKLDSDFNTKYGSTRAESLELQQEIFKKFRDADLKVRGYEANTYQLPYMDTIDHLPDDYSYDLFSDEAIPFTQIVLHGLVAYTSEYANERQQYQHDFLKDIEYGANPSFIYTYKDSADLKYAYDLNLYNAHFIDWESETLQQYLKYNEALGDVQHQFIVNHRSLASKVKETTYSGGKRIIVNYGTEAYRDGHIIVKPQDYLAIPAGGDE
ncbi:DUF5696 domain-containing protein [Paenibacillus eucommiae]|uniref:Glycosyl hydrolase family 101 n=1 Tax=Paenibacillus eucommiae TaxID=1355755 RepID=A0ABS4JAH2_9BACL|nr:DUF5696 domain-containing protein [Paenibacillus eucommiae]MBP1996842.1 hypothetical protein [Paenibacillus eucommiae]